MDGLECTEIRIRDIREKTYDFRIESEYYKKTDMAILEQLHAVHCDTLKRRIMLNGGFPSCPLSM